MSKLNPYFEVEGKKYEIIRTRSLECEYEKITQTPSMTEEEERASAEYVKLQTEYQKLAEKFREAEEAHFADILNKEKKAIYKAFKEELDEKYAEVVDFTVTNKNFSVSTIENTAYNNGVKLLILALCEQYKMTEEGANEVWQKFVEHLGQKTAKEWVLFMVQELFENDEDEENPFLKQARAKAEQRLQQRNGLKKVVK